MRRAIAAVLVVFLATSVQAHAQLFPPQPVGTPAERVLVDATLYVNPPDDEGLCMTISAGQVTIIVKRVQAAVVEQRPVSFQMSGLMADPDVNVNMPISAMETSATTPVNGAHFYCWSVSIDAPETQGMSMAQRGGYVQRVAVRIVHRPD